MGKSKDNATAAPTSRFALGVDPGLRNMGLALVCWEPPGRYVCKGAWTVKTKKKAHASRLLELHGALFSVFRSGQQWPTTVGVENQRLVGEGARARGETNAQALGARDCQAIALAVGWHFGAVVVEIEPQQARAAVLGRGYRAASKKAVADAVRRIVVRGVPDKADQHAVDAAAVAVAALQRT